MRRALSRYAAITVVIAGLAGCQSETPWLAKLRKSPLPDLGTAETNVRDKQIADVQFAVGRSLERKGDLAGAAKAYQSVLRNDPNRADACVRLAILYDKTESFEQSEKLFQRAIELDPRNPEIYCDRGYSRYLQNRREEAEADLRKALTLNPQHVRSHINLGLLLAAEDRLEESWNEFRQGGCDVATAYANLALALAMNKRLDDARYYYQVALKADPELEVAKQGLRDLEMARARLKGMPPTQVVQPAEGYRRQK